MTNGAAGVNGNSGVSGLAGAAGTSGSSGATGASGASGTTGPTGVGGGTVGASGASGVTGVTGASGATGATGAQGTSGTNIKAYDALGNIVGGSNTYVITLGLAVWNTAEQSFAGYNPNGTIWTADLYYTTGSCTGTAYSIGTGNQVFANNGSRYRADASPVSITIASTYSNSGVCSAFSLSQLAYTVSSYSGTFAATYTPPFNIH